MTKPEPARSAAARVCTLRKVQMMEEKGLIVVYRDEYERLKMLESGLTSMCQALKGSGSYE